MKKILYPLFLIASLSACADEKNWPPNKVEVKGRETEVFRHGSKEAWGYEKYQDDSFVVVHPKEVREHAPLYVVLHSAGHNVWTALQCTAQVGNHDIYHTPEDHFGLYLDCRANARDWWWGGMHPRFPDTVERNSGWRTQAD